MIATPLPLPPSSPEHIARRTRSCLSFQGPDPDPSDSSSESSTVSGVSHVSDPGSFLFLSEPTSDSYNSPLESSQVSIESQGLDILQRRLNMVVSRTDAALDPVLLDVLSNMGLPKNSAHAHALVSLGFHTLENVSW